VLSDLDLPDSRGLATLNKILESDPQLPVVVITGFDDGRLGLEALQKGAQDYLIKGKIQTVSLAKTVRYAIERKQTENKLRDSQKELSAMLENVPLIVMLVDKDRRVRKVNVAATEFAKRATEEMIGMRAGEALRCLNSLDNPKGCGFGPFCRSCEVRCAIADIFQNGANIKGVEAKIPLGTRQMQQDLVLSVSATYIFLSGEQLCLVCIEDVTKRKQAEEILRRDKGTLERLVKERSQELLNIQIELEKIKRLSDIGMLAAIVAHELRNPLAAINMASYNIKRKTNDSALLASHLHTIEKKVIESDQIINNLLFYSRIKAPGLESSNISDIIEECVLDFSKRCEKEVSIKKNLKGVKNISIDLDPVQIKEVVNNILNNACDAVNDSRGVIDISAEIESENLKVYFKDNGAGISKDNLGSIFDPFFTTKAKGTGLGLAVCRQIINLHGGTIAVESQQGKGTTFIVSLPAKK